jgi:diguanylate cyclase (GGDEF)-like protein/PAS domain S-box-containing protein
MTGGRGWVEARALADAKPVDVLGLFTWDRPGRRVTWSAETADILGVDRAATPSNRLWYATLHEDDRAGIMAAIDGIPVDARSYQLRYRVPRSDGSIRHVVHIGIAVDPSGPGPYQYIGTLADWTSAHDAVVAVELSHDRLRQSLDNQIDPALELEVVLEDGAPVDLVIVEANPALLAQNGVTREMLVGQSLQRVAGDNLLSEPYRSYLDTLITGTPLSLDGVEFKHPASGDLRRYDVRAYRGGDRLVISWRDVTDRQRQQEALASSERLFRSTVMDAAIGMAVADPDGSFRIVNPALCTLVGRDLSWFEQRALIDLVHPDDRDRVLAEWSQLFAVGTDTATMVSELRLVRSDGEVVHVRRAGVVVRDAAGVPEYLLVQMEDLTAHHRALYELEYRAIHDELTGLRNRPWIQDIVGLDLAAARRSRTSIAVLSLDLDRFNVVNDSLGHAAGDSLLCQVADRLAASLRPADRIGRVGGDEFVVVLSGITDPTEAEEVAEHLIKAVSVDTTVDGHRVLPTVSVGIALSGDDATPQSLLRDSDAALVRAKEEGRNRWAFADTAQHERAVARLTLEDALRLAVERHEFVTYYQPIVALASGEVVGHEALVRWAHPERGILAPAEFMDVAEASGIVGEIDLTVLGGACAALSAGIMPGTVSVNVSAVDLARSTWFDDVRATLTRHGVDPGRLVLEITETAALELPGHTRWSLDRLRDLGVGLHVDDFGTGFSSISLLQDLPVTGLKLDRRFVQALTSEEESAANALAAGLAGLTGGLGLVGVAEGVETQEQADVLRAQGWTHAQGWLFGRPAPLP